MGAEWTGVGRHQRRVAGWSGRRSSSSRTRRAARTGSRCSRASVCGFSRLRDGERSADGRPSRRQRCSSLEGRPGCAADSGAGAESPALRQELRRARRATACRIPIPTGGLRNPRTAFTRRAHYFSTPVFRRAIRTRSKPSWRFVKTRRACLGSVPQPMAGSIIWNNGRTASRRVRRR